MAKSNDPKKLRKTSKKNPGVNLQDKKRQKERDFFARSFAIWMLVSTFFIVYGVITNSRPSKWGYLAFVVAVYLLSFVRLYFFIKNKNQYYDD